MTSLVTCVLALCLQMLTRPVYSPEPTTAVHKQVNFSLYIFISAK